MYTKYFPWITSVDVLAMTCCLIWYSLEAFGLTHVHANHDDYMCLLTASANEN